MVGVLLLAGLVMLFALVMWKKQFAYGIGSGLGYVAMRVARLGRRPMAFAWGDVAVRFRRNSIDLMVARWLALSSSTIISHLTLYLVLLLALRFVGVSNDEVSWAQVLGVFAFGRLLTALPITPGGVGVVEVAYIGGIILAGRGHITVPAEVFQAQVAAGVLVFRHSRTGSRSRSARSRSSSGSSTSAGASRRRFRSPSRSPSRRRRRTSRATDRARGLEP